MSHLPHLNAGPKDAVDGGLRGRAEDLAEAQRRVLELVACGEALERCLEELCHGIERVDPAVRAGVVLLTRDGAAMARFIAPRLPALASAIRETPVGDGWIGTCARAALTGEPAHCADVAADARWSEGWKSACRAEGVRAASSAPVMGPEGRAIGTVCLCFDHPKPPTEWDLRLTAMASSVASLVIRRDAMDEALRESERRWRQLVEWLPAAVYATDAEGRITLFNEAAAALWGREPEQGERWCGSVRILDTKGREVPPAECPMAIALRERRPVRDIEIVIERPTGERRHVMPYPRPIFDGGGSLVGGVNMLVDLTDLRQANASLQLSESRYRAIVESQAEMVCWFRPEGQILFVNGAYARARGVSPEQLIGANFWSFIAPEDQTEVRAMLARVRADQPVVQIENRFETAEGVRWTLWTNRGLMFDESGAAIEVQSSGIDITDRKLAEEALRESEERFRTLADNISQLAWMADETGSLFWYNRRWYEYTGSSYESMQGWGWAQAHHPDFVNGVIESWSRALARGEAWEDTFPLRGRDGVYRWFLSRAMPIRDAEGRVVRWFGTNTDVTAQRAVEAELARHKEDLEKRVEDRTAELRSTYEQLRMSERMATMGVLAAGLGHDMGNLLLPIRVRLESLASEPMSARAQEDIEAIRTSADYLRRLANGLRLLSLDPQRSNRQEATDLDAWWADVQGVFQSVLPRGVELVSAFCAEAPPARISRASLTQIVFNLVQNAGEAMRDRGTGRITVRSGHEAGVVTLGVEDDGPGMSREVRERCMEPYFTTKTRGISTGLGLSLVYGLVREAGGQVEVETEQGRGATFRLRLAAAPSAPEGRPARRGALVEVRDPRLRSFLSRELRALEFDAGAGDARRAEVCVLDDRARLADVPAGASVLYLGDEPAPGAHRTMSAKSEFGSIRDALRALVAERTAGAQGVGVRTGTVGGAT